MTNSQTCHRIVADLHVPFAMKMLRQYLRFQIDLPVTSVKFEAMDPVTRRVIAKKYYEYIVDVAVMFGANRTLAEIEMADVIAFQLKMSNVSMFATWNFIMLTLRSTKHADLHFDQCLETQTVKFCIKCE